MAKAKGAVKMALSNTTTNVSSFGTTLNIVGGKFTMRVEKGTDGAESRTLTKGKNEGMEVWELKYKALSGFIVGAEITEGQYPSAEIRIADFRANDFYTIRLPLESRYLYTFIKALPNIDTSSEVSLEIVQGKKKTKQGNPTYNLHVVQNGKLVKDYYTEWKKESSGKPICSCINGMPDAEHTVRGWNFQRQEDWLLERFDEFFKSYDPPTQDDAGTVVAPAADIEEEPEYEDDIPF